MKTQTERRLGFSLIAACFIVAILSIGTALLSAFIQRGVDSRPFVAGRIYEVKAAFRHGTNIYAVFASEDGVKLVRPDTNIVLGANLVRTKKDSAGRWTFEPLQVTVPVLEEISPGVFVPRSPEETVPPR